MAERKGEVPFAGEGFWMHGAEHARHLHDELAQHALGLIEAPVLYHRECQVPRVRHHLRALIAQDAARGVEDLLVRRSCLLEAPHLEKDLTQAA